MRGELEYSSRWDGVAFHGSNIKSSPNHDAELFNRQLERFPDLLVITMLDGIDTGMHKFDNMPYEVTVLGPPKLMTVRTPTIGEAQVKARLLLWGEHPDFGIANSDPWKNKETIAYVTVSGNVWNPHRSFVDASHIGEEYDEMDSLFWQSLSDEEMLRRVDAIWHRRDMIREANRFTERQHEMEKGKTVDLRADPLTA